MAGPQLPPDAERRQEHSDATRALPRARIERLLSRRDIPLRGKTLWRMLYETAVRAREILALNVEDLDLEPRRAPVRSKGGDTEFVYRDRAPAAPAAALTRRHLAYQQAAVPGQPQASARAPPAARDICPHTGRRARVLFKKYTGGLELHQLRHSGATHLGDQKVPLQLIMAKTRHKSPCTVMRHGKPDDAAVGDVTSLLGPPGAATEPGRCCAHDRSIRSPFR